MPHIGYKKLKAELAAKPGVHDPGALAAAIGRRKYGVAGYDALVAKGRATAKAHRSSKK
jgi:hypothetical protein